VRIFLDSCIVIYLIDGAPPLRKTILEALGESPATERTLFVSPLVRLESRVGALMSNDPAILARFDSFFEHSAIVTLPIRPSTYDFATALRATHSLKTPDALHLATALENHCDEIWTNDRRFAKAASERIRVRVLPTSK
jgi:predicted nucleic acid-binding protein